MSCNTINSGNPIMHKLVKIAALTAIACSAGAVYAQSSVTVFGIIDTNVSYIKSSGNGSADSNLKCNTCHRLRFADVITSFVLVLSTTSA